MEAGREQYASFWRRAAAFVIDSFLADVAGAVGVVVAALIAVAWYLIFDPSGPTPQEEAFLNNMVNGLAFSIGWWLYYALFESSSKQAGLGKMALGIYVTDEQQHRLSFWRATGRTFGKLLSALPLFLGFLLPLFTQRKQALHDLLAKTLVLRKQ